VRGLAAKLAEIAAATQPSRAPQFVNACSAALKRPAFASLIIFHQSPARGFDLPKAFQFTWRFMQKAHEFHAGMSFVDISEASIMD
jgi:hypothetical protein